MITIGTKLRFRPSGWGDGKDYPGLRIPDKVTGTVTDVTKHLCVVEAEYNGVTIRECFGLYKGELRPHMAEVVR